jgi:hypothetical protein
LASFGVIHDAGGVGASAADVAEGVGGLGRRSHALDVDGGKRHANAVIVEHFLRRRADFFLDGGLFGGEHGVDTAMRDAAGEFRFHGSSDDLRGALRLEQVIGGDAHGVLHHHAHVNDVLIAGEKLGSQRRRASQNGVGDLAAHHQALQLAHLQLGDALNGPWKCIVQAGHHAGRDDFAQQGLDGLLIGRHEIDARERPHRRDGQRDAASRPPAGGRRRRLHGLRLRQRRIHFEPPSPFIKIFSNSESELRMAVVLSSSTFLYDSSVRTSL